jgi:hypothetical protein
MTIKHENFRLKTFRRAFLKGSGIRPTSVFEQDRWRGEVGRTPGYYEAVALQDDEPMARLAYTVRNDPLVRISWAMCPPLSCRNGPLFSESLSDSGKVAALRLLIRRVVRRHPLTSFVFTCNSGGSDANLVREEFIRAGFEHTRPLNPVRHPGQPGLMMPQLSDDPAINKRRSHINNARGKLDIIDNMSPDDFLASYNANLVGHGKKRSYLDTPLVLALLTEGLDRGQARLLGARQKRKSPDDPLPPLDAAIAIVWDQPLPGAAPTADTETMPEPVPGGGRCYLLLLTHRPISPDKTHEKPVGDANKVLIMEASDFASRHGLIFDVCGWATPGAQKFYRQLFPGPDSVEFLDVFTTVRWHARWYEKQRTFLKAAALRHGMTGKALSSGYARILWKLAVENIRNWLRPPAAHPEPALRSTSAEPDVGKTSNVISD